MGPREDPHGAADLGCIAAVPGGRRRRGSARRALTREGIGGRLMSHTSAWVATTRSILGTGGCDLDGQPARRWAGPDPGAGEAGRKRPRAVTSSPRQSRRTAERVSSSHAIRSRADGNGRPKHRDPPAVRQSRSGSEIGAGAIRSRVAAAWARRAAFQWWTRRIEPIWIRSVPASSAAVTVQPSSRSASPRLGI